MSALTGWISRGLCAQTDPEVFFPEGTLSTKAAKRVCGQCEVNTECLSFALENPSMPGVWGGTTAAERRALKKTA